MNLTNGSSGYDNGRDSPIDEDNDNNILDNLRSAHIENFYPDNSDSEDLDRTITDDDDDGNGSDIENHCYLAKQLPMQNRLCSLLRQSNHLMELKLNTFDKYLINNQNPSLQHILSDTDVSKQSYHHENIQQEQNQQRSILLSFLSSNYFYFSTSRSLRLCLPSSHLCDLQTKITQWLQASTHLIDSISMSIYHGRCWPQLLLTYFIEKGYVNLEFSRCAHSSSLIAADSDSCSVHSYGCIPEDDAYKLCSILQKGSRFSISPVVFDHIRRIIISKSMQEAFNGNTNLHQVYVKQLKNLKQSLVHQQSSVMNINNNYRIINITSIYSKLLLFLSSLYSIKAETMRILFCQHLLHNSTYSYLVN